LVCNATDKGLIGHWKLNEGTGDIIKDSGPNKLDGKLKNPQNIKWIKGRNGGNALFFDAKKGIAQSRRNGGAVICISGMDNYDFTKGMSICFWLKLASDVSNKTGLDVFSTCKGSHGPGFRLQFRYKVWRFLSGDGKKLAKIHSSASKNPITKNEWIHVALTYQNGYAKIYMDGKLIAFNPKTKSFNLTNGASTLTIGGYRRGYWYFFDGALSDFRLYSRALSSIEIIKIAKNL
jgi:hypothetical protein